MVSHMGANINMSDFSSNPDLAAMSTLHVAAVNGEKSTLELLLKKSNPEDYKCDVNEGDKYGRTALVYTVLGGWYDCAILLLRNGATVNKQDRDERTPLHWAAYLGKPKFVNLLLRQIEKDEDCNSSDLDGRTPLHYAAAHRNSKCLRLLLKRVLPGKIDVADKEKKTALHWSVYYGNFEHVKLLLRENANFNLRDVKGNTLLHLAVTNSHQDSVRIVRLLLKLSKHFSYKKDGEGRTSLHLAVANENEALVKELSATVECRLDELDRLSRSALHYAVLRNNVNIVKILISNGASLYKADDTGVTALHYAAKNNNPELVNCFLSEQKLEDIPDNQGRTALMWAASQGSKDVLDLMLKNPSYFSVHACDKDGLSALHFACIAGNDPCVKLLIAKGADVSLRDKLGQTPLFKACQQGHLNVLRILMGIEGDFLENSDGARRRTAHAVITGGEQGYAGNWKHEDKCLQTQTGVNENQCDNTGCKGNRRDFFAKLDDQNEFIVKPDANEWDRNESNPKIEQQERSGRIIGEEGDGESERNFTENWTSTWKTELMPCYRIPENLRDSLETLEDLNGCTPLHFAAHAGHVAVCKWLVEKGVDPGKKDSRGRIALHGAAFNGHTNCMALMLSHRPELVNDLDKDGNSALHRAAVNGHLEAVKLLVLGYEAFCNYREKTSNLTPLDCAIAGDHQDVTQFLIDHGALTVAGVQQVASDTIKRYLRSWIWKRKLSTLRPLLEKHEMLTREESVRHLENGPQRTNYELGGNSSLGKQEHLGDMTLGLQDKLTNPDMNAMIEEKPWKKLSNDESEKRAPLTSSTSFEDNRLIVEHGALVSNLRCPNDSNEPEQLLIDMISDLPLCDDSDQTSLFDACLRGHLDLINALLASNTEVNSRDENGCTPIHLAALRGHESVCRRLIENGADLGKRDVQGLTPLHKASMKGHVKCMDLLLQQKPELISSLDCDNRSALHCAASSGYLDAVKLLMLSYNAQLSARSKSTNQTALDCAILGNHENVIKFMSEHGVETTSVIQRNPCLNVLPKSPHSATQESAKHTQNRKILNEPDVPNAKFRSVDTTDGEQSNHNNAGSNIQSDSDPWKSESFKSCRNTSFPASGHLKYLPEPPKERSQNRTAAQTVVEKHSRAPDSVVVASEKEKIFRLRRDWERIALLRQKIHAAVIIQKYFRQYKQRNVVEFVETGRPENTTTGQNEIGSNETERNRTLPLPEASSRKHTVRNRLRTNISNCNFQEKVTAIEGKKKFKSCFPPLLQSDCGSSLTPTTSTKCSVVHSPRKREPELSCRSKLTTNEIVEQWLDKASERDKTRSTSRRENTRRTRSANVPSRKTNESHFLKSHSLPESSRRETISSKLRTEARVRSLSLQRSPQRPPMSSHQRQLYRELLVKSAYASPAALSYNFALDTYHPLASRRGCKQATFPFKTSTRVRPNSMKRDIDGWVHTTKFAQEMTSSDSSYDSR